MSEWREPVEVKEKRKKISALGVRNAASKVLGVISIISTLIALSITISFNDGLLDDGSGWPFGFFLFVFPLMIFSFAMASIGILISGIRTLARTGLCSIAFFLPFSPILIIFIMVWIGDMRKELQDKREEMHSLQYSKEIKQNNYSYEGGVKFNKEKVVLIEYSKNKKETNYIIPDSVTSIGNNAFANCTSLRSITIPDTVTSIGDRAFYGCTSLNSITIPEGVTSIGYAAFTRCTSLTSITIPDSVTSIGERAFDSCKNLTSVTIGNSINSIGENALYRCNNLTTVIFLGNAPKLEKDVFVDATPTIYRKSEAKGWGDTWGGRPVKLISEKP